MIVAPLSQALVPDVMRIMDQGAPYIRTRTQSDYWLYARLFSSTCPVALIEGELVGAIIAFRSQDNPSEVYVQDVVTHPGRRRTRIAQTLLSRLQDQARSWECTCIYLTSEPDNTPAHATWLAAGFVNIPGDQEVDGVSVITDYKGPGKNRAVYELRL